MRDERENTMFKRKDIDFCVFGSFEIRKVKRERGNERLWFYVVVLLFFNRCVL